LSGDVSNVEDSILSALFASKRVADAQMSL